MEIHRRAGAARRPAAVACAHGRRPRLRPAPRWVARPGGLLSSAGTRIGSLEGRLAAATALAIVVAALVVLVSGAPVAWFLLAITGATTTAVLVRAFAQRRYFEPLTIVA